MKKTSLTVLQYISSVLICIVVTASLFLVLYLPLKDIIGIVVGAVFNSESDIELNYQIEDNLIAKKAEIVKQIAKDNELHELGFNSVVKLEDFQYPWFGDLYGTVKIERLGIDCNLYMGDTSKMLRKGAGTYYGASIPGSRQTTIIAAHCTTYFKPLEKTQVGDLIHITTTYGDYEYEVTETKIVKATEESAFDYTIPGERLILYTCYPLNTLRARTQRFVVYAKLNSGTLIDFNNEW